MTDKEVEDIIRSNMNFQMNLSGIRQDFEEKLQRTWVGLTDEEIDELRSGYQSGRIGSFVSLARAIEAKLKAKNSL